MENKTFGTAINCIDGRTHLPLINWAREKLKIEFLDMITEAGPDKLLSESKDNLSMESIKKKIKISIEKHKSKAIIISGHWDCAGNPVGKEEHIKQIQESIRIMKEWNFGCNVFGVFIDENWKVLEINK